MNKSLDYYKGLQYPISLTRSDGEWEAWHPDLGRYTMSGFGETPEEAVEELNQFRHEILEQWFEKGKPIPEPVQAEDEFSGKFMLRLPRHLHAHLARAAKLEGTSLNQYLVYLLSQGVALDTVQARLDRVEEAQQRVAKQAPAKKRASRKQASSKKSSKPAASQES